MLVKPKYKFIVIKKPTKVLKSCLTLFLSSCSYSWHLTHWGLDKINTICRKHFQMDFLKEKSYIDSNFTEVCSEGCKLTVSHDWFRKYLGLNTMRQRQNGRHSADDTFNRIFVNENVRISIKFSLKFVHKGPTNNITALVQIMAWRHLGNKPFSEAMMDSLPMHICIIQPQWVKEQVKNYYLNQIYNIK